MDAVRYGIIAAVAAALTATATDSVEVMPSGDPPPTADTALQLFDGGHRVTDAESGTTGYMLTIGVDGYVRDGEGLGTLQSLNALYALVIRTVFANAAVRAVTEQIDEGDMSPPMVAERADRRWLAFSLDLHFHFMAQRGDPALIN